MRTVGTLGMSPGTSLALEGGGGQGVRSADVVLFNLRTLIRNARDAYQSEDREKGDADQLTKDVEADMIALAKWIEEARRGKPLKLVVYYPTYKGLKGKYPHATLWEARTAKQKAWKAVADKVADNLVVKYDKLIEKTNVGMPDFKGKGVVMTNHVVDLAECPGYTRLHLLESYTGVLKPFTQWYTKLTGGDELYYIPFNRLTLQIFGDKSTNFRSSSEKIKSLVKKIAEENHWTSASTVGRVRGSINNLPLGVDRSGLLMMM